MNIFILAQVGYISTYVNDNKSNFNKAFVNYSWPKYLQPFYFLTSSHNLCLMFCWCVLCFFSLVDHEISLFEPLERWKEKLNLLQTVPLLYKSSPSVLLSVPLRNFQLANRNYFETSKTNKFPFWKRNQNQLDRMKLLMKERLVKKEARWFI